MTCIGEKGVNEGQMEEMNNTTMGILETIYDTIIVQADIFAFELDCNNHMVFVNSVYDKYFGDMEWENADMASYSVASEIIHPEDIEIYFTLFDETVNQRIKSVICRVLCKDKQYKWFRVTLCEYADERIGNLTRKIGMLQDVNSELLAVKQMKDYEEYDSLTGLYNDEKFELEVQSIIQADKEKKYCIVALDVNRFKIINEVYDTKVGNNILKYIANVLREVVPKTAICSRMYADTFSVFMEYTMAEDVERFIDVVYGRIHDNPYGVAIATSYGVFLIESEQDRELPVGMMRDRALIAKKTIKKDALTYYAFFSDKFRTDIILEQEIESEMYTALAEKQFVIFLQPKVKLSNEQLMGAEALVRWRHPQKGLLSPDKFIPVFEGNGFIVKLDEYVCEEVCKFIRGWIDAGIEPVPISVNLSRLHIYSGDIIKYLTDIVKKYEISPQYLRLEVTETLFMADTDELNNVLTELHSLGFKVEMDDFGSGYSSLNMLRTVPVDTVKIDKDFFGDEMNVDKGKIVVGHTISMAKELEMEVIAEGVETKEHVAFLKNSKCDVAQGFFFSKPMPLADFESRFFRQ